MSDLRKSVGARVRNLRRSSGLTQERLGELAGLSYKFVGEIERGLANPTIETLDSIAKALEVELADLISGAPRRSSGYGGFSAQDYSLVREAREAIDTVLDRLGPNRGKKSR